jgi:hypothetical protein
MSQCVPEPNHSDPDLKPQQVSFLSCLFTSPSVEAAANRAGISRRTGSRWLHEDPAFQKALAQAKQEAMAQAVTLLSTLATAAVTTLGQNLKAMEPAVQVRPAHILLDACLKLRAEEQLEERLAELEGVLLDLKGPSRNGAVR